MTADSTEEHRKELRELQVAAQTVVESIGSAEESNGSLAAEGSSEVCRVLG